MEENLKVSGKLHIVLTDENGNIKEEKEVPNLVVTVGKGYITGRMLNSPVTAMSHMEVGTSSDSAAAGQTALVAPIEGSRSPLTSTVQHSQLVTNDSIRYQCTFGPGAGTGSITEAGIFNAASAGTMLCRSVFGTVTKSAGDSLAITWTITLT